MGEDLTGRNDGLGEMLGVLGSSFTELDASGAENGRGVIYLSEHWPDPILVSFCKRIYLLDYYRYWTDTDIPYWATTINLPSPGLKIEI